MSAIGIKYREELVTRIRDLIDGYDSSSLLKEYLQNADDSGANELVITFDKRDHIKLHGTDFAFANSPALMLSNDSIFKDNDFDSIVKISSQGKVEDAASTGRFGQGFSSSFSISDHPSFISNDRAYWFDVRKNAHSTDREDDILRWDMPSEEIADWLDCFKGAGLNSVLVNKGTIFRLPLRTEKYVENDTNNLTKISDEIFTYEDFLNWCDEWKNASENLLFLRNIYRLVLQEIDEDGNKIIHLSIETDNHKEISQINKSIQSEFKSDLEGICQGWLDNDNKLPQYKYKQHFTVSYLDRNNNSTEQNTEHWAVVNGLFRGENNVLIKQALKALAISPNPRKVLPWAGAAVQLDKDNLPIKSSNQWYTFLPLPVTSKHPVHLHGWFDLNPKRTEITSGGSGYDKEVLTRWNELLMEYGVGASWAMLIDYIKNEQGLDDYYSFWAKHKTSTNLEQSLSKGFYTVISKLNSTYIEFKNEKYWIAPTFDTFLFNDDNPILHEAFREHFKILTPKPNNDIVKGLKNIDVVLPTINPEYVRSYISETTKTIDFPIFLADIKIAMLSKKEWFVSIVSYCANQGMDYDKLDGLPLQLTIDGKVSLISSHDIVYGDEIELEVLQNKEELILDPELTNDIVFLDKLPISWLPYSLKNVIHIIYHNFDEFDLNITWVEQLSKFIYKNKDEIHNVKTMLRNMKIVLLQDKTWGMLNNDIGNYSPILIKEKDIDYIDLLEKIGLNLIYKDHLSVYKPLAKVKLIATLDSYTLSKYLLSIDNYSFLEDKVVREYVLDKITEDTSWYDHLNQQKKNKFNRIPFIHTVSDNVCSLDEAKLFISTKFNPPKHIKGLKSDYDLIDTTDRKHLELFSKMGIKEQTPETYIKEIILPYLKNSENKEECLDVLKWFSSEWKTLVATLEIEPLYTLKDLLKSSSILPTEENQKKNFNEVYDPIFFNDLPVCLRDEKYQVISFEGYDERVVWREFLEDIGLKQSIMPQHIIYKVNQIVSNNVDIKAYESSMRSSICLANYIIQNIDRIDDLKYLDKPLLDALKQYAWLPAQQPKKFLVQPNESYSPLMKSNELVRSSDAKIASGEYFILTDHINFKNNSSDLSTREIARRFGIVTDIPNNEVFSNFRKLIKYGVNNSSETEDTLLEYTKEFYAFLGRKQKLTTNEIPSDILRQSIRIDGNWIPVQRVFKRKFDLRGIYSWKIFINQENNKFATDIEQGLELLGVRDKPDSTLVLELLNELPVDEILSKEDLSQAKILLKEIQLMDELDDTDFPLLTRDNKLVHWEDIYINDLPAYDDAENKNIDIDFCHEKFLKLADTLGVDSLTACHEPSLNQEKTIFDNSKDRYADEIENYIKHKYFKEALLRLLFNENKITAEEVSEDSLVGLLALKIMSAKKLVVDYYVYGKFLFSDENITAFEDKSDKTLYILEQDDLEDTIESIVKFISGLFSLTQDSTFIIQRILREQMNQNEINIHLNRKHIKSLPKEFDMEEESIFDGDEIPCDTPDLVHKIDNVDELDNDSMEEFTPELDYQKVLESKEENSLSVKNSKNNVEDLETTDEATPPESLVELQNSNKKDTINEIKIKRNDFKVNKNNPLTPKSPTPNDLDLGTILDALNTVEDSSNNSSDEELAPPTTPRDSTDERSTKNTNIGKPGNKNNKNTNNSFDNNIDTKSGSKKAPSSNNRMPVYVGKDNDDYDEEQSKERQRLAKERGDKGENLILKRDDLKLAKDNILTKASENNPGFDLIEKTSSGELVRYIEVKTLSGEWKEGGVALTPVQLKYAMSQQDKWWLFVVEGLELDNTVVHQLENPVLEANKFMFDSGWKELAIREKSTSKDTLKAEAPKEGDIYIVNESGKNIKFEITKVIKRGEITMIRAKKEGENSDKIVKLNEKWEKLSA